MFNLEEALNEIKEIGKKMENSIGEYFYKEKIDDQTVNFDWEYIFIDNKKVGIVTSSTWSPYQVCGVSIVHMSSKEYGPETEVKVLCDDGEYHNAEICSLPMYDSDGDIPRGLKEDIPSGPYLAIIEPSLLFQKNTTIFFEC